MELLMFLIAFPAIVALLLVLIRQNAARNVIVVAGASVTIVATVVLGVMFIGCEFTPYEFNSYAIDIICTVISCICGVTIIAFALRYKNLLAGVLAAIQIAFVLYVEFGHTTDMSVAYGLYIDSLSLILALTIGVIGSGICIYAIGYMTDFQAHEPQGAKDRRPTFFALMFVFLSAMFIIVFSNNLCWMFAGWEVTTLCSFLLIGYTKTEEAIHNAFRQINMNLLGGIAFAIVLMICVSEIGTLSLNQFLQFAVSNPEVAALPVILLAFAGMTKAAQMPFQSWLLGAMVAPTPTSALLHSSTMVKAGVFMLVKLAPCFLVIPVAAVMVMLVGAVTFLLCSFMAISQSNAKRVLAYSTIANLGLITTCAGVGTPEAVWAAIFLILFHAIAKSLLFLCVGTAEHHIGSRDIESMDLLFDRMPRLARFMMLGIMCMFIAPFGMLVAKWATLVSFAEMHQVALILVLAFGSAATFMFWAKWLGKLAGIAGTPENVEMKVHSSEWFSIMLMAILLVCTCVLFPIISAVFVEPYIVGIYGLAGQDIATDNLWIASICTFAVVIVLFLGIGHSKKRRVDVYLAGINKDNDSRAFQNSMSGETLAQTRNWYMEDIFGEAKIAPVGVIFNTICMMSAVVISAVGLVIL